MSCLSRYWKLPAFGNSDGISEVSDAPGVVRASATCFPPSVFLTDAAVGFDPAAAGRLPSLSAGFAAF